MNINPGLPAFPVTPEIREMNVHGNFTNGLTKREYFAIHIMAGLLQREGGGPSSAPKFAVQLVDLLFEELEKPKCS